jgi:hypothetical protein
MNEMAIPLVPDRLGTSMENLIRIVGIIVIDDHVDAFNIDSAAKQVRGDEIARVKVFEGLVLSMRSSVFCPPWMQILEKLQSCKRRLSLTRDLADENNDLVEFKRTSRSLSLRFFFGFGQLAVVHTVQGELGFVVDVNSSGIHW